MKNLSIITLFVFYLLSCKISSAQWQPHYHIFPFAENSGDDRHPSFSRQHTGWIADAGQQLWLAYDSEVDSGNSEIFLRMRERNAVEWQSPVRLTFDEHRDQNPDIVIYKEKPYVVWESNRRGNFDLMYSVFDQSEWSEPTFVCDDPKDDYDPKLIATHEYRYPGPAIEHLILVWSRAEQLQWSRFTDGNWQNPQAVASDTSEQINPFLVGYESSIWLVWQSNKCGNWDIFGSWMDNNSNAWSQPLQLTEHEADDQAPTAISSWGWSDAEIIVVWQSNREGNFDLCSRGWWQEQNPSFLTETINLTVTDSSEVDTYGLFIPYG